MPKVHDFGHFDNLTELPKMPVFAENAEMFGGIAGIAENSQILDNTPRHYQIYSLPALLRLLGR